MTTLAEITRWFNAGKADENNTHMIVVCDTFDWEDYPVYVSKDEDVRKVYDDHHQKNMQKVMEVYNYSIPAEEQLTPTRVLNF